MKIPSLVALIVGIGLTAQCAQNVIPARLHCLSIMIRQGLDPYGDTLDFNSTFPGGTNEVILAVRNPEITFPDNDAYTSNLAIYDDYNGYASFGTLYLTLPTFVDANNNKFHDFFESSLACSTTSGGFFSWWDPMFGSVSGSLAATWSRAAGAYKGTCRILLDDPLQYYDLPFVHFFELLEYKGTLAYTPGTNSVSGTMNLAKTGAPAQTLQGPVLFRKDPADPFNALTNAPGEWLDAGGISHVFTNHLFLRDANWPTNYAGYIEFDDDGDQNTFLPWSLWVLSLDDRNDGDRDGIPDFSDLPQVSPPRAPQISIVRGTGNLLLTIRGDVGRQHKILRKSAPGPGDWEEAQTLNLATDPQTVPLAIPANTTFWRVQAE